MNILHKLIEFVGYNGLNELKLSFLPSAKYTGLTIIAMTTSSISSFVMTVFGLESWAFIALMVVFLFELATGLKSAFVRAQVFTSAKFSRFLFKVTYYLILISITYLMSVSFENRGQQLAASAFRIMHDFVTVHIVLENLVSITENLAMINGKEKSHWIMKLRDKINQLMK